MQEFLATTESELCQAAAQSDDTTAALIKPNTNWPCFSLTLPDFPGPEYDFLKKTKSLP
jgi:hypothetical protein